MDCCELLREPFDDVDVNAVCEAIASGHTDVAKSMIYGAGDLEECMMEVAAMRGDLEMMKWLKEHGCPWSESTTSIASLNGGLRCIQYAVEHGCTWCPETTFRLNWSYVNSDAMLVLVYAKAHGHVIHPMTLTRVLWESKSLEVVERCVEEFGLAIPHNAIDIVRCRVNIGEEPRRDIMSYLLSKGCEHVKV
jgi:hypothetical protein